MARYAFRFAALPEFLLADRDAGRIKRGDLGIVAELIHLARDGVLSGYTDASLAAACRCAESTFKLALARLRAAGRVVVRRVRWAFRRVLVLPWLARDVPLPLFPGLPGEPPPQLDPGAENRPPGGRIPDPPSPPPLTPLIGGEEEREDVVVVACATPTPDSGAGGPPPPPPCDLPPDGEGSNPETETAEQVAALVEQAQAVLPREPAAWVKGLARRWSLRWVAAALARAQGRLEEGATIRTGYVVATLRGFDDEGGPPEELLSPPPPGPGDVLVDPEEAREAMRRRLAEAAEERRRWSS